jgi:hypothetical protein
MNTTAYENETLELSIDELDAVSGGFLVELMNYWNTLQIGPPIKPAKTACNPTGGGAQN